ncbi:MAG: type II secretion system F family protein, partial [Planctomycetaceae bacterium]
RMDQPAARGEPISLEQLIALNNQIIALVRAGVPLELGLADFGEEEPTALGRISSALAARMSQGMSLSEALAAEGQWFPRLYRLVVEAGLKTGRLTVALEAISGFAWELVDLRRRIGVALLYPVIVFLMAYGLFLVFVVQMTRRLEETYRWLQLPLSEPIEFLIALEDTVEYWWWIPPAVVAVLVGWWLAMRQASLVDFSGPARPLRWIPGMRPIERNYRLANFADLLAMLVEHDVPLDEGLTLAAEATGDEAMQHAAHDLARQTRQGESRAFAPAAEDGLPSFLRWLIARGKRQDSLAKSLRLAADMYRRRAVSRTEWLKVGFPLVAGLGIGGTAVLAYALALFLPLVEFLKDLA